ncbi:deoxyribodipyrimidine photo-lyase [Parachlamydia sp. AcF125]|uniref:cryptochrome/photolyase family protein n=1 Tax=Parachlamydia sp. AcF125 TaxID=2795736 RepID=UPI001BC99C96|nr:deoxyribodipyrimidine photo-lyase [Parachlamydia sp. AcF125]MBS4168760.1 Deoxyribodipyrimidine photo-lyase [Parachlamydia sp. AcF125]
MGKVSIVWMRQDLRVEDHPALNAAAQRGSVLPVYIWSPQEEGHCPLGGASRWWLHHSLKRLENDLRSLGLPLIIRKGKSLECLKEVIKEAKADALFWSRQYEPYAIKREIQIKAELTKEGVLVKSFPGNILYEPWTIQNKQGKPFQVFTFFWKNCLAKEKPLDPLPAPMGVKGQVIEVDSLDIEDLNLLPRTPWDEGIAHTWKPGSAYAKEFLAYFLEGSVRDYHERRDRPDLPGTSRLSPYLHFGEISVRTVWHEVVDRVGFQVAEPYLRQLGWRDFAYHLLYHFPHTLQEPMRPEFASFPWKENKKFLKAWQKGVTGYPFVDAGMRQLWMTGWMHNRARLVVGSFLVKDLLLPWQKGAAWFWDMLVDADLANNTLGWQWVAGCGADAAPYFRIFNPATQGKKFDPEGNYVRKWIPEIANLPDQWIHQPWEAPPEVLHKAGIKLGEDYPYPIVNHEEARLKALEAFEEIKTS